MNAPAHKNVETIAASDSWLNIARSLGSAFSERASAADRNRAFVSENYCDLKQYGFFSAAIPATFGGGGASYSELSAVIREIGRHCGSTALAFSMHSHPVMANVYKYLRGDGVAAKTLQKIASDQLIIAGTGANDWLESSGSAERVKGGYLVNARKRFVSGSAGADLLVTSVSFAEADQTEILHFAVPFATEGVRMVETWDTLGMRGTGSNDVVLENVFIADARIVGRRPAGVWHPMWNVTLPIAMPLIVSAYVGMAEAAVGLAIKAAGGKQSELSPAVGQILNALTTAQLALDDMVRLNGDLGFTGSTELTSQILTRKTLAAEAAKTTVELAAELVGGPGFFSGHPIERMVRDVRAVHFHPLPSRRQQVFSGRVVMGRDPVTGEPAGA
jgi:alkylation response protein AidB-like acyl-CoA dehydrogenase